MLEALLSLLVFIAGGGQPIPVHVVDHGTTVIGVEWPGEGCSSWDEHCYLVVITDPDGVTVDFGP